MSSRLRRLALGLTVAFLPFSAMAQDLTVGLAGSITSIDPHYHNVGPNNTIAAHIFDRLVDQDEQQRLIPGLATSWKAIDDTTWEFKLRQGVTFHDGTPFGAPDVLATFKRVPWVPNSPSSFSASVRPIAEVVVVDDLTLHFKTAKPAPLLANDLASVNIISRKAVEAPTAEFNSGPAAIGTGPYKFVSFQAGDRVVLARNDAYWGAKPHWKDVVVRVMPNNATRTAALLSGDVQIIDAVPSVDLAAIKKAPNLTMASITSNRLIYLHLDSFRDETPMVTDKAGQPLKANPLKDPKFRAALSHAINRKAIVDRIFEGEAIAAGGFLPEGFFGASAKFQPDAYDVDLSKKLLAEAGFPNGLGMTIHGPSDRYPNADKVIQAIGPMFTRAGIETKVQTQPWSTYATQSAAPTYAFSVMLVGWGSGTGEISSPLRALVATPNKDKGWGASNRGRYSNPKLDAMIDEVMATIDDKKREALMQEATALAMQDHAIIPLFYNVNSWAMKKGLTYAPRADEYTYAMTVKPAG